MRTLNIIPIVHSAADLGRLAPMVANAKHKLIADSISEATARSVGGFWSGLQIAIENWSVDFSSLIVFQDALPVTPQADLKLEHKIVEDLAAQGSKNHKILKWLVEQGATLVGTESPELLLQEYELAKLQLETVLNDASEIEIEKEARTILGKRDEFIAGRIDECLSENDQGVIFLGMVHSLDECLSTDICVEYPFGQPKAPMIHT